jgi:hypothetical protein
VPKKGLEPPHPCEYMDLNHARLPIPPLRHWDAPDNNTMQWKDLFILPKVWTKIFEFTGESTKVRQTGPLWMRETVEVCGDFLVRFIS